MSLFIFLFEEFDARGFNFRKKRMTTITPLKNGPYW